MIASKAASNTQFADKEQIWADNAEIEPVLRERLRLLRLVRRRRRRAARGCDLERRRRDLAAEARHERRGPFAEPLRAVRLHDQDEQPRRRLRHVPELRDPGSRARPGTTSCARTTAATAGRGRSSSRQLIDNCFVVDPVIGRCVEDGIAGARNDLSGSPNMDIANGAPSGAGATNRIVDNYVTGPALNQERVWVTWSVADEQAARDSAGQRAGAELERPAAGLDRRRPRVTTPRPRCRRTAAALYVVYNAYTTPYRDTTFTPRGLVGVFRSATMGPAGPGGWTTLNRSPVGDPTGVVAERPAGRVPRRLRLRRRDEHLRRRRLERRPGRQHLRRRSTRGAWRSARKRTPATRRTRSPIARRASARRTSGPSRPARRKRSSEGGEIRSPPSPLTR